MTQEVGGMIRYPAVAGQFYPAAPLELERMVRRYTRDDAEKVEIVDANGNARAWIEIDGDGNPGLFLARENCILASFSLVGAGKPRLDFGDNCSVRALLKVDDEGNPSLTLFDREHKAIWAAP